jgi:hypothetical protein
MSLKLHIRTASNGTVILDKGLIGVKGVGGIAAKVNEGKLVLEQPTETSSAFADKLTAVHNGGSGTYEGTDYSFSGGPYYIATINDVSPYDDGYFYMLGSKCTQIIPPFYNGLHITDICRPRFDCDVVEDARDAFKHIDDRLELIKNRIIKKVIDVTKPPVQSDLKAGVIQAVLKYNWLLHKTAWRVSISVIGQSITTTMMFTNYFNKPVKNLELKMTMTQLPEDCRVKVFVPSVVLPPCMPSDGYEIIEQTPEDGAFGEWEDPVSVIAKFDEIPVGCAVRIYVSVSIMGYRGVDARVLTEFSNNLAALGYNSYPEAKFIESPDIITQLKKKEEEEEEED